MQQSNITIILLAVFIFSQQAFATSDTWFFFDQQGKVNKGSVAEITPLRRNPPFCKTEIMPAGFFRVYFQSQSYTGSPGDYIFPLLIEHDSLWLLSEKDSDYSYLLKWHPTSGTELKIQIVNKEINQAIFHNNKLCVIQYGTNKFINIYFDPEMQKMHNILTAQRQAQGIIWQEHSPVRNQWIVRLLYHTKPEEWLVCDIDKKNYNILTPNDGNDNRYHKKEIFYTGYDGENISGILSYPANTKQKYPLIVFPHGGPGIFSSIYYDYRVDFLVKNNFVVFQPNYRGSRGFGKKFRQQGWKSAGIQRSITDIVIGTENVSRSSFVDKERIYILGGSWGGFLVLALLTQYPDFYKGGVCLFGVFDLPEMLKTYPSQSKANKILDHLQFGNIQNHTEMKELARISPINHTEKLQSPLLLVHFEQDEVIEYKHTLSLWKKFQTENKKNIFFFSAPGSHGFKNETDELTFYKKIVDFFNTGVFHE